MLGLRTKITTVVNSNSRISYARPRILRTYPDTVIARDFNATIVIEGEQFGFRDSHIDSIAIGGLPCVKVQQGADLDTVRRFAGE